MRAHTWHTTHNSTHQIGMKSAFGSDFAGHAANANAQDSAVCTARTHSRADAQRNMGTPQPSPEGE
jgi:hypothetical protein